MEFNAFLNALKTSLTQRGIEEASAARHVAALSRTFKPNDIQEIQSYRSPADFSELSDNLAAAIKKKAAARAAAARQSAEAPRPAEAETRPAKPRIVQPAAGQPSRPGAAHPAIPPQRTPAPPDRSKTTTNLSVARKQKPLPKKNDADSENDMDVMEVGENGKRIFWIAFCCALPLTALAGFLFFGGFALLYAAVALAILFCIVGMVLLVAGGSAVALAGLIYGVIRMFSVPSEGLYEIGLAVIIVGIVTLLSILLYNLALRLIPRLFTQVTRLFRFAFGKVKKLYNRLKKECYKL